MGTVRKKYIESLDNELAAIYRAGGYETKRAEAIWTQIEKLEAEEAKEAVS